MFKDERYATRSQGWRCGVLDKDTEAKQYSLTTIKRKLVKKVSVPISYLSVILIWSTTPLAIQWSGNDVGFQFGVAARMLIGLIALVTLLRIMNIEFPWHKRARTVYLISGISFIGRHSIFRAAGYR
jgi:hypothetical protein